MAWRLIGTSHYSNQDLQRSMAALDINELRISSSTITTFKSIICFTWYSKLSLICICIVSEPCVTIHRVKSRSNWLVLCSSLFKCKNATGETTGGFTSLTNTDQHTSACTNIPSWHLGHSINTISLRSLWNLIGVSGQCTISISGYINSMPLDAMPSQAQWRIRKMNMYFFKLCDGIFYIQLNLKLITIQIYEYFMTCIHISISFVCKNLWINSNYVHTLFYYI